MNSLQPAYKLISSTFEMIREEEQRFNSLPTFDMYYILNVSKNEDTITYKKASLGDEYVYLGKFKQDPTTKNYYLIKSYFGFYDDENKFIEGYGRINKMKLQNEGFRRFVVVPQNF
jgi:hypothetical protein